MRHKMMVMLAVVLAMMVSMKIVALPYIVFIYNPGVKVSADGTTLTFNNNEGSDYSFFFGSNETPAWCSAKVTKVVFKSSFAEITPSSTANWFRGCTNLKTIEGIENLRADSVKTADGMFYDCKSLTTLDLSGFNTYKLTSCLDMFAHCSKLKTIYGNSWDIVGNMTPEEKQEFWHWEFAHTNQNYMFDGCTSLVGGSGTKYSASVNTNDYTYCHVDGGTTNPGYFTRKAASLAPYAVENHGVLTLYYDNLRHGRVGNKYDITFGEEPEYIGNRAIKEVDIDSSMSGLAPTSMSNLFQELYEVTTIRNLKNLNASKVTDMNHMFYLCCSLKTLDLSGLNTANVTNMSYMLSNCYSLSYVKLRGLNTSNVTNMSGLFNGCLSLSDIDFGSINTSKVTDMNRMFNSCLSLKVLDMSNFNTSKVTTMREMFGTCCQLQTLIISSFNTANVTDMAYMFYKCNSLKTIALNNFNTAKVTNMAYMFGRPSSEFTIRPTPPPAWYNYYTSIYYSIEIPDPQLTTIDISSFNTANVTDMTSMFECQPELTTIFVGNGWNTTKVEKGSDTFLNSTKLVGGRGTVYNESHTNYTYAHVDGGTSNPGYLTLKGSGTGEKEAYAVVSDNTLTFYYDNQIYSRPGAKYVLSSAYSGDTPWHADYAGSITKAVVHTSMKDYRPQNTAYWFYNLYNMTTIEGLQNLNTSEVTSMRYMFSECTKLESVDVSSFNTANVTSMRALFACCYKLNTLDLSSFNTTNVTEMWGMFYLCSELTTIYVGNGWSTANVSDGNDMFVHSTKLVGGKGTTYDDNHVDYTYAHVDGGPSNPGYLTYKANWLKGDVNGDGEVGIGDIVAITNIMAGITGYTDPTAGSVSSPDAEMMARADVNGDGTVGIGDIVAITNIMAGVD